MGHRVKRKRERISLNVEGRFSSLWMDAWQRFLPPEEGVYENGSAIRLGGQ